MLHILVLVSCKAQQLQDIFPKNGNDLKGDLDHINEASEVSKW